MDGLGGEDEQEEQDNKEWLKGEMESKMGGKTLCGQAKWLERWYPPSFPNFHHLQHQR